MVPGKEGSGASDAAKRPYLGGADAAGGQQRRSQRGVARPERCGGGRVRRNWRCRLRGRWLRGSIRVARGRKHKKIIALHAGRCAGLRLRTQNGWSMNRKWKKCCALLAPWALCAALGQNAPATQGGGDGPAQSQSSQTPGSASAGAEIQNQTPDASQPQKTTRITSAQAKALFRSMGEILTFASDDSRLPIEHKVKRRLIGRRAVERYIMEQFKEDKDAKRMQREEIVLDKFGLLDRDFHLRPFLVSLLTEQIAGFYDNKTKTVNLLDWVAPDDQKPVMAHELTHALQDQHTNLEKWDPDEPDSPPKNVAEDNSRLAIDERDTARDAVLEGQAMAVYVDYTLKPSGRSLVTSPNIVESFKPDSDAAADSPVMARAPLLLQESLLFPYREGLGFEQAVWKDKGAEFAFAGVLDQPPNSSYEIMNPRAYERRQPVPLLRMPDVHGLLDAAYQPYDIGVMGELDVRILTELYGGEAEAEALTPQWNGGLYYAAQSRSATTEEQKASTASVSLLYLSAWKTKAAAQEFAALYARELTRKYSRVERETAQETSPLERIYNTNEGPVLIVRQGRKVFTSESFDLDTARKLQFLLFGAQQGESVETASRGVSPLSDPADSMARFMARCGMAKAALLH